MTPALSEVATHLESLKNLQSGNLRVVRERGKVIGKCVLECGHLPQVLFLTKYARKELFTR